MSQKITSAFGASAALLLAILSAPVLAAETQPQQAEQTFPSIIVTEAVNQQIADRVFATGTIQPLEHVNVAPLVEGLSIRSLEADIGDTVEAGSVIAILNDDALLLQKSQNEANLAKVEAALAQIEAQLAEAMANADEAVRVRDRSEKLAASGSLPQSQADQARASAAAALARVNSAEQAIVVSRADIKVVETQIADIELRLSRTAVKAPVSGLVSARNARVGAIAAGAGEPLFTIIKNGKIELKAEISEGDVLKLAIGQKANVMLIGASAPLSGTVRLIQPTIDPQTRLGNVLISLDEPEKARVGMFGNAEIIVEEKTALVLPLTAITTAGNETTVRKVEDGVVKFISVKTGIQDGRVVEITEGLAAEDQVVAKAGAYVRDGDRITPVQPPAATN